MAVYRDEALWDVAAEFPADDLDARFRRPLMAFFLRRVANRAEAEDMTQEVFVRLLRHDGAVCASTAQA